MQRISIKTKLVVGVTAIILAVVAVALTAVYALTAVNGQVASVVGTRMPQSGWVHNIKGAIMTSAISLDEAALASTQEEANGFLEQMNVNRKATGERMQKLKDSLQAEKGKALFQAVYDRRGVYMKERDLCMEQLRAGKKADAQQTMVRLRPLRKAFLDALNDLEAHVEEEAALAGAATRNTAGTGRMVIISLVALSLAIAALALPWILKSITGPLQTAIRTANRIADKDLTVEISEVDGTETGQLMAAMREMVANLKEMITRTVQISGGISLASNELHSAAVQMATGAEEVAAQTNTVATASEEMSATSCDIARNCTMAAEASQQTTASAAAGAEIVNDTITGMSAIAQRVQRTAGTVEALGTRSEQIGAIVGTIEDIADQTNLLALNAAIEAARAGEQGRGFAVVADEVRALAERTTKATREIGEMIKAIQNETREAVKVMNEGVAEVEKGAVSSRKSEGALKEIMGRVDEVTMQINQIATAAEQQTATTGEVTSNILQITEVISQSAQGAERASVAASKLTREAAELQELVSRFRLA